MKPHPRIRKTIKWGGAAVTVLLVVVWIGSGWATVSWFTPWGIRVGIIYGGIDVAGVREWTPFDQSAAGWYGGSMKSSFEWWFEWRSSPELWRVRFPPWFPVVVCSLLTARAWRLDTLARRRAKLNLCPKCGYDRTGLLKDAKCPECGTVPEQR